jgi:hypothetical protein
MRLYATEAEIRNLGKKGWQSKVEIREGEFGPFAVLMVSTYEDFAW